MAFHVGMIGLGLMGTAMSRNLLERGFRVTGFDVLPQPVRTLQSVGGQGAGSAAAVARVADVVMTSLPNGQIVEEAILGPQGVADGGRPGLIVLETSTVAPATSQKVYRTLAQRGMPMLDATVSGISHMVAVRDCIFMVGGEERVFEAVRPIWDALARAAYYLGPSGAGAQMKLVTNLIMGVTIMGVAEGLALGMKAGLNAHRMLDVLRDSAAASRMLDIRGQFMADRKYEPPVARIDVFLKDIALMLENSREHAMPVPMTELMERLFRDAKGEGYGAVEIAAVIETYRRRGGLHEA